MTKQVANRKAQLTFFMSGKNGIFGSYQLSVYCCIKFTFQHVLESACFSWPPKKALLSETLLTSVCGIRCAGNNLAIQHQSQEAP